MLGAQFDEVAGGNKVQNVITGLTGVNYDEEGAFEKTAPQIQIPSGGAYDTYYFLNDGWYDNGTEEGALKPGWCDMFGSIVDAEFTPGIAIWLKSVENNAVVNTAGAVPDVESVEVDCPVVFSMRANAFPMPIEINSDKMVLTGIAAGTYDEEGEFEKSAPQIQIPSGGAYNTFYYLADGWYDDGSEEGALKPGWCDMFGSLVYGEDATIPVAQGFWLKGVGSTFKVKFVKEFRMRQRVACENK